ncbi:MAG TPA: sigma-70 family RNA polymerase sigma factor [Kofleriaceae bacterium]|jgi:RNA polymerase sigma-70 factor (ECF subfamily)
MSDDRLTALYRMYGPAIYARCIRLLGDPATAEDATQETFLRAHRHLAKAPNGDEALVWIYRIATNYCLNEIRNRKHRPVVALDELPERIGDDLQAVLADRDLVARLVARGPAQARAAAWLHFVDGLDQGEVARVLGASRRTIVTRLAEFTASARAFLARSSA